VHPGHFDAGVNDEYSQDAYDDGWSREEDDGYSDDGYEEDAHHYCDEEDAHH